MSRKKCNLGKRYKNKCRKESRKYWEQGNWNGYKGGMKVKQMKGCGSAERAEGENGVKETKAERGVIGWSAL